MATVRDRPNSGAKPIRVHQFLRRPVSGWFSIEQTFEDVRAALPADIDVRVIVNSGPSRGILPRLRDSFRARRHRAQVNHILGDTHYLAWWMRPANTILTVHDCVLLETTRGIKRRLAWLLWYWWPLKRVGRVTVVSAFSRDALCRWVRYPVERITVIPPPLAPGFAPAPPPANNDGPRLLQLGVAPNKNRARIIEAVAGMDVTLVMIGNLIEEDESLARRLGVRIENHHGLDRAQLLEQFRRADMLVFPSTYEGFGMPIIEAQAIGRPVVTGNVAAMPEAAGGAACLVDPFDVASIRAGIRRVLDDPSYAAELVERGYANAERYRVERVSEAYAEVYRQVAGGVQ